MKKRRKKILYCVIMDRVMKKTTQVGANMDEMISRNNIYIWTKRFLSSPPYNLAHQLSSRCAMHEYEVMYIYIYIYMFTRRKKNSNEK